MIKEFCSACRVHKTSLRLHFYPFKEFVLQGKYMLGTSFLSFSKINCMVYAWVSCVLLFSLCSSELCLRNLMVCLQPSHYNFKSCTFRLSFSHILLDGFYEGINSVLQDVWLLLLATMIRSLRVHLKLHKSSASNSVHEWRSMLLEDLSFTQVVAVSFFPLQVTSNLSAILRPDI